MDQHVYNSRSRRLSAQLALQVKRARHLGIEFLQTELDMAQAFLDLAETTQDATAARRNLRNTAKALDAVGMFIERLSPRLAQRKLLGRRAGQLRRRLADVDRRSLSHSGPEPCSYPQGPSLMARRDEHQRGRKALRQVDPRDGGSHSS